MLAVAVKGAQDHRLSWRYMIDRRPQSFVARVLFLDGTVPWLVLSPFRVKIRHDLLTQHYVGEARFDFFAGNIAVRLIVGRPD